MGGTHKKYKHATCIANFAKTTGKRGLCTEVPQCQKHLIQLQAVGGYKGGNFCSVSVSPSSRHIGCAAATIRLLALNINVGKPKKNTTELFSRGALGICICKPDVDMLDFFCILTHWPSDMGCNGSMGDVISR